MPAGKVFPRDRGACVVGVNLRTILFQKGLAKVGQRLFIGGDILFIKVFRAGNAPDVAPVDVFQRDGARGGRFAVALNAGDGAFHCVVPKPQVADLLVDLLVFTGENLLNQGNVLGLQHTLDFLEAHTQFLHIGDHVQARVLVDVIIPVAGFPVHVPRLEQAELIVQAQRRHRNLVHLRHFTDRKEIPFHDKRLQTLMFL